MGHVCVHSYSERKMCSRVREEHCIKKREAPVYQHGGISGGAFMVQFGEMYVVCNLIRSKTREEDSASRLGEQWPRRFRKTNLLAVV